MNKICVSGNMVADPVGSQSEQGVSYCRFTVAVQRRFNRDETDFFEVVCFRQTADFVTKYLEKGAKVIVSGSLQTRRYEKDGVKRTAFEIFADDVESIRGSNTNKSESGDQPEKKAASKEQRKELEETADDLPF